MKKIFFDRTEDWKILFDYFPACKQFYHSDLTSSQLSPVTSFVLMVHHTQSRQKYQLFETQKKMDKKRNEIKVNSLKELPHWCQTPATYYELIAY